MNAAVFLDRDGTLIEESHYLCRPEDVKLLPGTGEGLNRLQAAGYKLVIVTNQSGVGRGYFTMHDVEQVNERVCREFANFGVRFDRIYIAPEAPDQPSRGRKPSPQFLFDARDELALDLGASFIVGDKMIDLECGWNAGVKGCFLVRTGYGRQTENKAEAKLALARVVDGLPEVAQSILGG